MHDPTPDAGGPGGVDAVRELVRATREAVRCIYWEPIYCDHKRELRAALAPFPVSGAVIGGASSARVDKGPALHVSAAHGPASTEPLAELAAPDVGGRDVRGRTAGESSGGIRPTKAEIGVPSAPGRAQLTSIGETAGLRSGRTSLAPTPASPVLPAPSSPVTGPAAAGSPSPGGARPCGCGHETWEHTARGCMAKVAVDEWCPCPRWRPATVYEAITEAQRRARQRPEDETLEETARRHFLAVE